MKRKVTNKSESPIVVGASMPRPLAKMFVLRCVHDDVTKSDVLREMVWGYVLKGPTTDVLCQNLGKRLQDEYKHMWNKTKPLSDFKKQKAQELEKEGIASEHIQKIMDVIGKGDSDGTNEE